VADDLEAAPDAAGEERGGGVSEHTARKGGRVTPTDPKPRWWKCCDAMWRGTDPTCWVCGKQAPDVRFYGPQLVSQGSPGGDVLARSTPDSPAIL
jgi:hypothetical protein